jgi:hypothetical protein
MNDHFRAEYLKDVLSRFHRLKELGDRAIDQVSDEQFFTTLNSEDNSIAIIAKHMAGNMRSRWTRFLESDGEKPDRHRDREFEIDLKTTRSTIIKDWETGWSLLFTAVNALHPQDMDVKVRIRGNHYTVLEALNRQLIHYALHVGQIIMLAKHFASDKWTTLSIPRGQSEEYNRRMREQ